MTLTVGLLLALAALIIGYAKTAIGGLATISVAIFASVMPARESTAAILLLLIIGDVVAVWHYRRDADLSLLRRLIPAVLPGLALGAVFLAVVDDTVLRRSIGVLLLAMVALQLVMRWRSPDTTAVGESHTAAIGTGLGAGFATMTANAAGTVMTLYLVAQGWRSAASWGPARCSSSASTCARSPSARAWACSVPRPWCAPPCWRPWCCWARGRGCTPRDA